MKPHQLILAAFLVMLLTSLPGYGLEGWLKAKNLSGLIALQRPSATGFNAIVGAWRQAKLPIRWVVGGGYAADLLFIAGYGGFFYLTLSWLAGQGALWPATVFIPLVAATADLVEDGMEIWMIGHGANSGAMAVAGTATFMKFAAIAVATIVVFIGLWRWPAI